MSIIFEADNDVIIYAFEKIISYARENHYIFLAQSIWWISSIVGLQQGLVSHIDQLGVRTNIGRPRVTAESVGSTKELENQGTISTRVLREEPESFLHPDRISRIQDSKHSYIESKAIKLSTSEDNIHNEIVQNCEDFLERSRKERKTLGRRNRQITRILKDKDKRKAKGVIKTFGTQTHGIAGSELRRRKAAGGSQRCAWPKERKGSHKTIDCLRWPQFDKGTAPFNRRKSYRDNLKDRNII